MPEIIRTTASRDRLCETCHCPIFIGETIHLDSVTLKITGRRHKAPGSASDVAAAPVDFFVSLVRNSTEFGLYSWDE